MFERWMARFGLCDLGAVVKRLFHWMISDLLNQPPLGKALLVGIIVYGFCRILLGLAASWVSGHDPWAFESRILRLVAFSAVHLIAVACAIVEFRLNTVPKSPDVDPPEEHEGRT